MITLSKAELRKHFREIRRNIPPEQKTRWDDRIFHTLIELSLLTDARIIMTYLSCRNEVDTFRFVRHALDIGKRIAVPKTDVLHINLIPAEIRNLEGDLHIGHFKVYEPRPETFQRVDVREIDVHIIPGVAFDLRGHRIGYSRGFYDRFLSNVPPDKIRLGLAYECQITEAIPQETWDVSVTHIVTEQRTIICHDAGRSERK